MNLPISDDEIRRFRDETEGCKYVIHFNHCVSSLMPKPVVDAVVQHTHREAEIGGYEAKDEASVRFNAVYDACATLLNAKPSEIALVENATRAWDMAFYSIPFQSGDRILTSVSEYSSNVIAFMQIATRGVSVEVVPNDEHDQISLVDLGRMLDSRVRLVAVTHMPTNGGLVQPAAAVGRLAKRNGSLYLLDACQTVGQLPLDVADLQCDFLSATSRKFLRGPRGVGFLYARSDVLDQLRPVMLDSHAAEWDSEASYKLAPDAKRFENWEKNYANHLGMGAAIEYELDIGLTRIWERIQRQVSRLRSLLNQNPRIRLRDLGLVQGAIVSFELTGVKAEDVELALRKQHINTSTSGISGTRFDMEARRIERLVRASVHYFTTDDEIDHLAAALDRIA